MADLVLADPFRGDLARGGLNAVLIRYFGAAPDREHRALLSVLQIPPAPDRAITLGTGTVPKPDTNMQPNTVQPAGAGTLAFVQRAAQGDMAAIQSSKLALERFGSEAVRRYAVHIIKNHGGSSDRLHKIALREALAVPERPDEEHARKLDELRQASPAEFDRKYTQLQAEAHGRDIPLYTAYADDQGANYHLRDFAADELTVLKSHAQQLQALQSQGGSQGNRG